MGVESGVGYIDDLVVTNPESTDVIAEGDDHLRLIKAAVKGSFTSLGSEAVTKTAAEINDLVDKSTDQTITGVKTLASPVLNSPTINTATINGSLQLQAAVATTSGTALNFTSVATWVKRITILFNGVSTNGTSDLVLTIGDSGGLESTGYTSKMGWIASSIAGNRTDTTYCRLTTGQTAASLTNGSIVLEMQNTSTNTWVIAGNIANADYVMNITCNKALTGVLDRFTVTSQGGTNTFDAGTISVTYE